MRATCKNMDVPIIPNTKEHHIELERNSKPNAIALPKMRNGRSPIEDGMEKKYIRNNDN